MKNKSRKINVTVIVLLILATLLTLLILSNKILAINAGEKTTIDKLGNKTVGDFARYIAYSPNAFMGDDVNKIFSLDNDTRTWYRLDNTDEPLLNYGGNDIPDMYYLNNQYYYYVTATWYNTALCIYYSTAGGDGATSGNIVNVIDIDTNPSNPSMTTYYESNGSVKSQYTSLNEGQNQTMTSYAYLINQASLYERKYDSSTGKWPLEGTFTKDLSSDSKISGWSRMYDTRAWNNRPISRIKEAIIQVLYGGHTEKQISKDQTVLKIFSNIKDSSGKRVVNLDYAGLTDSYYRVDFERDDIDSTAYVNSAITAGSKAVKASCEFKTTDDNGNALVPQTKIVGNNAYIGPFAVIYTGGTPTMTIEGVTVSGWARLNTSGTFETTNTTAIPTSKSNDTEIFYLVVPTSSISNKVSLNVNVNLGYEYYKARVAFTAFRTHGNQNLMFYTAKKYTGNLSDSKVLQLNKKITIQKQDANGNDLKIEGIIFEVYNSSGTKVGTLTTNENGTTESLPVENNKEYTIKEISNSVYGYKGCMITDAKITSGQGTISVSDGIVKINVSENTTVGIKNQPKLGQLIIHKKGADGENLSGVEFVIYKGDKYLKLNDESVTTPIETPNTGSDMSGATTVATPEAATKFKTNASGKIVLNNLEIYSAKDKKFEYWVYERSNPNYAYGDVTLGEITVTGGTELSNEGYEDWAHFDITNSTTVEIENKRKTANLEIVKEGEDNTKLEDVVFLIKIDNNYLQLKNSSGTAISSVKGTATINPENVANSSEYCVSYVAKENATKFVTDANGKIVVKNIETNKTSTEKYTYTAEEISNPNYGYGSKNNVTLSQTVTNLPIGETSTITFTNTIDLGNLKLEKNDENNTDIKLENVGFAIQISPAPEKTYAYLALYDSNGKIVTNVKGTATINRQNMASTNEYEVRYYCTNTDVSKMTATEKAKITTFKTQSDGTLTVNNLEVYKPSAGKKYTYKLTEISNENYGYIVDWTELGNITLETASTVSKTLTNNQVYTKLSGYVWLENPEAKSNNYDSLYGNSDIKLTDLYKTDANGKVIELNNSPAQVKKPIEIKLYDKVNKKYIKTQPNLYSKDGEYTFVDLIIEELENYEIRFVYDGYYYTTVVENIDKDNGSKVKEVPSERTTLSDKFGTVKSNGDTEDNTSNLISKDGKSNKEVEYQKNGHISTVSGFNFDTSITANTTQVGYNLKTIYDNSKANSSSKIDGINNNNMGIVLREQPHISLNSDIYDVQVQFEGYSYHYKYNGRQNHYESIYGEDFGVKFEEKYSPIRYTRTIYASDVQASKNLGKDMTVLITYKMKVENQSRTLSVNTKQIINYFDDRYEIKAVGLGLDETTHTITNTLNFSTPEDVVNQPDYKSTVIEFNQTIAPENQNIKDLYITFEISTKTEVGKQAIHDLLNEKSTYHNVSEIFSYSSYYGANTSKVDGKQYITDITKAGEIYAGIDKMSQPGNAKIVLIDHSSGDGTKVVDTANFEDDTSSAPSLLLEATNSRTVAGKIFEDRDTGSRVNEKIGDGKYNNGEKPIQNVKVQLLKVNNDGSIGEVAKYSNGALAETVTDANGNYIFGSNNGTSHIGITPGKYVIQYIYNNESVIVDASGNRNINVNDYKSTIITSNLIKNAFNGQNPRWYLIDEGSRYSDAKDDISLRIAENDVKYSTYKDSELPTYVMKAYTPVMDIGIEFTSTNSADALTMVRVVELNNVDFGIIERPNIDITIEKEITSLEITTQNGTSIVPKGNPTDLNSKMQYVKKLDGLVSAEIEAKLLQGASLNLEYTVTMKNNCQIDYAEEEYYFYGIIPAGATPISSKPQKVVDYLDNSITIDWEQNEEGVWIETTSKNLYDNGLISEDVKNELNKVKYHIMYTEEFKELETGSEKSVKLYTNKYLAVSDSISTENSVEIIELSGGRTLKQSIPGNYNPAKNGPNELDDDMVRMQITPPTGTTVNYAIYIIAAVVTFTILVSGIVIIKKKIMR